jgi:hypothetical protein
MSDSRKPLPSGRGVFTGERLDTERCDPLNFRWRRRLIAVNLWRTMS